MCYGFYFIRYTFGSEFERELKREVFKIVPRGREFGTFGWYFRACVYITLYFYLQYLWVTKGASWQLALAYGFVKASMGLNVQHDANHGAASKTPWINHLLGLGADLIGGSKWLWMQQHWTHHAYTNHSKKDPDTHGSEPVFLFHNHPKGHPIRSFVHKFQPVYFFILASLYWVTEMFNPASWNLKHSGALNSGFRMDNDYTVSRRKYARIIRFFYILIHVVAPIMKQGLKWSVIGNILLMGGSGSVILAVLFAISHNFEGADRDPTHMLDTKKGDVEKTPVDWYKAQVETSSSYGGFISGYLTGGLNFQVEHHLFPRMSSSWYPYIAPVVRDVCRKHNVKYVYFPWVFQNIVSSVKYLYQSGTGEYKMESPYSGKL